LIFRKTYTDPLLNHFSSVTAFPRSPCKTHFNNIPLSATLHCPIQHYVLQASAADALCSQSDIFTWIRTSAATRVPRREPGRRPPPVGMITSLSRFITWRMCAQERRKCARDLCRCASAGRYIDLVQIQRLLVQTDGDLREASLGPARNKCGTITHCFVQGCHPAGQLGRLKKRFLNCEPRIAAGPQIISSSRRSINKSYMCSHYINISHACGPI